MIWKPKYEEIKKIAMEVKKEYNERIDKGEVSKEVVIDIANKRGKSWGTIYKYLKYANSGNYENEKTKK